MYRRLQLRQQITMLLVAMRISYGGTILALLLVNANTQNAIMWQIVPEDTGVFGFTSIHLL